MRQPEKNTETGHPINGRKTVNRAWSDIEYTKGLQEEFTKKYRTNQPMS